MSIGDFIKKRRKALGLSADDLAVKIGKNRATIYRYESSYIEKLPSDVLVPLAEALHITPGDLIMKDASPAASDLLPLTADEESLLSKYRRLASTPYKATRTRSSKSRNGKRASSTRNT